MQTSVLGLQAELEKARESLKGVEETIKKNIGRDISSGPLLRPGFKRGARHLDDGVSSGDSSLPLAFGKEGRRITFSGPGGGYNTAYNNNNNNAHNNVPVNNKFPNESGFVLGQRGGREHDFRGGGGRGSNMMPPPPPQISAAFQLQNNSNNVLSNNNNQRNVWLNNNNLRGRPMEEKNSEERISVKRRLGEQQAITVFSRLSGPPKDEEFEEESAVKMTSQVIVQDVPSRKEILAAQTGDNKCKERNKRMFGALLGTLQKFRQEENKLKDKEEKRAQVERKLEEAAQREKEEAKRARQELFLTRRHHQMQIRRLEYKLMRLKQLNEWEATKIRLLNFIQTKTTPKIFFLPKIHNAKSQELLAHTRTAINKIIEAKRAEVEKAIDEHMPDILSISSMTENKKRNNKREDEGNRGEEGDRDGEKEDNTVHPLSRSPSPEKDKNGENTTATKEKEEMVGEEEEEGSSKYHEDGECVSACEHEERRKRMGGNGSGDRIRGEELEEGEEEDETVTTEGHQVEVGEDGRSLEGGEGDGNVTRKRCMRQSDGEDGDSEDETVKETKTPMSEDPEQAEREDVEEEEEYEEGEIKTPKAKRSRKQETENNKSAQ